MARELADAVDRYRRGAPRDSIFHDLVLSSILKHGESPTVLDIGCGRGFDGNEQLQRSIAQAAGRFIGIEPDPNIRPMEHFTELHNRLFEDSPLTPDSVDIAYASFVLEHIAQPEIFWRQMDRCLSPGGIFWGFTVDARHPFSMASQALQALRLKDLYLDRLRGRRGTERYENYPTHYLANTPRQIRRHTRQFGQVQLLSFHRVGQLDYYFPRGLWPVVHAFERVSIGLRLPGSLLVIRVEKRPRVTS